MTFCMGSECSTDWTTVSGSLLSVVYEMKSLFFFTIKNTPKNHNTVMDRTYLFEQWLLSFCFLHPQHVNTSHHLVRLWCFFGTPHVALLIDPICNLRFNSYQINAICVSSQIWRLHNTIETKVQKTQCCTSKTFQQPRPAVWALSKDLQK